jgi:hypothetical protein
MEELRENFSNWLGTSIYKLDLETIKQINSEYIIEKTNLCKYCNKRHLKGCCDNYNSSERTRKNVVKNIEITYQIEKL